MTLGKLHITRRWEIEENRKIWREIEEGGLWDRAYIPYEDEEIRFTGQSITGTAPDCVTIGLLTIRRKVKELIEENGTPEEDEEIWTEEDDEAEAEDLIERAEHLKRSEDRAKAARRADLKKRYEAARRRYEEKDKQGDDALELARKREISRKKIEKTGRWKWKVVDGKDILVPITDPD